eukprot:837528-Rhodomonas_salina.2
MRSRAAYRAGLPSVMGRYLSVMKRTGSEMLRSAPVSSGPTLSPHSIEERACNVNVASHSGAAHIIM